MGPDQGNKQAIREAPGPLGSPPAERVSEPVTMLGNVAQNVQVDHGEARHLTAGARRASRGQLERWEPRVRAVGAKHAEFTQKDAMPRERQHLRSLVFSALVDSGVLEEIGLTDRRAKVYRLRAEDA